MGRRKKETGWDRLRAIALWQWGLLCIVAGGAANAVGAAMQTATGSAGRAEAMGRAVGALLFVVVGVGLIIAHFVRKR